jgi:methylenetetrahydrofolate dehydrogenase (NADP+)/methenyltetrahydrofolate cyclohydrolase
MADARVLLGRPVARAINDATSERAAEFALKNNRPPLLAVLVSPDPASESYLKTIRLNAKKVSAEIREIPIRPDMGLTELSGQVTNLNEDDSVDGILVQTPLPDGVKAEQVGRVLNSAKDVDGVTPYQSGLLFRGAQSAMVPSTARAVIEILDYYRYGLEGLEVIVVGRSLVIGKPVGILALGRNATVTWCHSKTKGLPGICKRAEILIAAIGRANMIDSKYVRPSATVIDVGINVDEGGNLVGDVKADDIKSIATAYTPVPGGVGPVTTACLFDNLLKAAALRQSVST